MKHPDQAYRTCVGILKIGQSHSAETLEAAAAQAVARELYTARAVTALAKHLADASSEPTAVPPHPNVRGPAYYQKSEEESLMLPNATRDHLQALRLSAMAEAWARQQADPTMAELSFDERFGLLVDAEWVHRQNRRWARRLREAQLRLAASPEAVGGCPRFRGISLAYPFS
ncbi:IstB ATP binding domain protein (plasmid) [Sulfobacillus acidophilus DSM 10332]|uniref:IstB ATP binding domain protein n=1 Tax=Sulfobacillus acidophilus (strain ATCC 700253 / DSM 10332 / NAL) TaxID=679936 RepID=G8U1U6_SULAD|nr:IstB ATP binding domain protein [Sulfobacillus acidophilus DSM 10332]